MSAATMELSAYAWITKSLGEICTIATGKRDVNQGNLEGEYPFFTCAREHTYSDTFSFDTDALLVAGNGDVGHVQRYSGKFEVYQRTYVLFDFEEVSMNFLFHVLDGFLKGALIDQKLGNTMPYIKVGMLKSFPVPVPPLAEQERIVAILDEAFEGIATATAHAERNLHNARELVQSVLQSTFRKKGEDWVETTLGDSCKMYQPKTIGTKDLVPDGPYPVFGANGIIGRYDQFNHEEPQVLVTCRGATCGAVNVSEPFSWVTGNAMVVHPLNGDIDLRFLEYAFRGGIDVGPAITGSAQPQITRTNLNPIPFGYPRSLPLQAAIVQKLDALSAETRRLEAIYERKLAALAKLKQSLLRKAFSGNL